MDLQYGVRIAGKQLLLEGHFFFFPLVGMSNHLQVLTLASHEEVQRSRAGLWWLCLAITNLTRQSWHSQAKRLATSLKWVCYGISPRGADITTASTTNSSTLSTDIHSAVLVVPPLFASWHSILQMFAFVNQYGACY